MSPGPQARRDRWSAAGLAVLALAYCSANRQYPLDTLAAPGPGVFPLVVGLALLVVAGWQIIAPGRQRAAEGGSRVASGRRALVLMGGLLVAYAAGVGGLGFFAASFVLVVLATRLMGTPGWGRPALLACGIAVVTYLLFVAWLGVPLPRGLLR